MSSKIRLTHTDDFARIDFLDSEFVNEAHVADLRATIDQLIEKNPHPQVVLNFSNVDHLSSVAIGEIVLAHRKLEKAEGQLHISKPTPNVMEIFEITGLTKTLNIL